MHVLGVRRLRCHWLPHHRQPQGAAGGQPYRLPGALQREISTLIALITMFFVGGQVGLFPSLQGAALLLGTLLLGVAATLGCSKLLSSTVLRGVPSSFTLELPPSAGHG